MLLRKIASLTAALAFLGTILTSVVLFICPQGRVAYWADWRLWGLSKEQWGDVHITLGTLFLAALCLHIWYNWKPLMAYLKDRARRMRVLTPAFVAALALCLVTVVGTLGEAPPFSLLLDLADGFKDAAARTYGEPPYGHAELSTLRTFATRMNLDLDESLARLEAAGLRVAGPGQTLQNIAETNRATPQQVYQTMLPEQQARPAGLPADPPPGTGVRTLADLCADYGLNIPEAVRGLADQGITARPEQTIKEIAGANSMGPIDVYEALRRASGAAGG